MIRLRTRWNAEARFEIHQGSVKDHVDGNDPKSRMQNARGNTSRVEARSRAAGCFTWSRD
jgi:hypothetical protein